MAMCWIVLVVLLVLGNVVTALMQVGGSEEIMFRRPLIIEATEGGGTRNKMLLEFEKAAVEKQYLKMFKYASRSKQPEVVWKIMNAAGGEQRIFAQKDPKKPLELVVIDPEEPRSNFTLKLTSEDTDNLSKLKELIHKSKEQPISVGDESQPTSSTNTGMQVSGSAAGGMGGSLDGSLKTKTLNMSQMLSSLSSQKDQSKAEDQPSDPSDLMSILMFELSQIFKLPEIKKYERDFLFRVAGMLCPNVLSFLM